MRAYLTAHAAKQHERQFGWKTFRVLTVTTDHHRMQSMMEALRKLRIPQSPLLFHDARRASDQRSTRPRLARRQQSRRPTELGWRAARAQRRPTVAAAMLQRTKRRDGSQAGVLLH